MPADSILVSVAVISMFLVFAGALIWVDFYPRPQVQKQAGRQTKPGKL